MHYGQNIYYSPTYMHYLRDYPADFTTDFYRFLFSENPSEDFTTETGEPMLWNCRFSLSVVQRRHDTFGNSCFQSGGSRKGISIYDSRHFFLFLNSLTLMVYLSGGFITQLAGNEVSPLKKGRQTKTTTNNHHERKGFFSVR